MFLDLDDKRLTDARIAENVRGMKGEERAGCHDMRAIVKYFCENASTIVDRVDRRRKKLMTPL